MTVRLEAASTMTVRYSVDSHTLPQRTDSPPPAFNDGTPHASHSNPIAKDISSRRLALQPTKDPSAQQSIHRQCSSNIYGLQQTCLAIHEMQGWLTSRLSNFKCQRTSRKSPQRRQTAGAQSVHVHRATREGWYSMVRPCIWRFLVHRIGSFSKHEPGLQTFDPRDTKVHLLDWLASTEGCDGIVVGCHARCCHCVQQTSPCMPASGSTSFQLFWHSSTFPTCQQHRSCPINHHTTDTAIRLFCLFSVILWSFLALFV